MSQNPLSICSGQSALRTVYEWLWSALTFVACTKIWASSSTLDKLCFFACVSIRSDVLACT